MTTHLRQRMIEDMQLRGLAERTQEVYVAAVRQLAEHYGKSPDQISDEELRQYFLYRDHDCPVRHQVPLRADPPPRMADAGSSQAAAGAKATGRSQSRRSPSHPGLPASALLSRVFEYHLLVRSAPRGRRLPPGLRYR